MLQVPSELANGIVPQLEAWVTVDTCGERAQEASRALVAVLPCHPLLAFTFASRAVTLGPLRAQRVALAF